MYSNIISLLNGHFQTNPIENLSITDHSKAGMQKWVNHLPMLNVGKTGKELYTTLQELLVINLPDSHRFDLIEVIRPALYSIIESLSKHYINQNTTLDQRAERISVLAQLLRGYSAMIYCGIACRAAEQYQTEGSGFFSIVKKKAMLNLISKAIHRALTEFFHLLSHSRILQLSDYQGMWLRIHELYKLAMSLGLTSFALSDKEQKYGKMHTIEQIYLRSIFLSLCQTDKLRPADIKKISQLSELWCDLLKTSAVQSGQDLLVVDTSVDAPIYTKPLKDTPSTIFYVDVRLLLKHFGNLNSDKPHLLHPDEKTLLSTLLNLHLFEILQPRKERVSERQEHEGMLSLELGLISSHYQLAGLRSFEEVIQIQHIISNLELTNLSSDWNQNHEKQIQDSSINDDLESYQGQIVNISSNGYCIRWVGPIPNTLRSGELICIRKNNDSAWNVGVIRWIQQHIKSNTEFGVELLSEHGIPCGARVIHQNGYSSDYMRTLLLPKTSEQTPSSVIVPTLAFKAGNKISIRLGSEEVLVQLTRKLIVTHSFSQIEFVPISKQHPNKKQHPKEMDWDFII